MDKYLICTLDEPNKNGRVYRREVWEKALLKAQPLISAGKMPVYGSPDTNGWILGYVASLIISGSNVVATINWGAEPQDSYRLAFPGDLSVASAGYGTIKPCTDGTLDVLEYELTYLFLTKDPA